MRYQFNTEYCLERDDAIYVLEVRYNMAPFFAEIIAADPNNSYPVEGGEVISMETYCQGRPFEISPDEGNLIMGAIESTHFDRYPD